MKESRRAAMDDDAHKRIVAWAERNASAQKVNELKSVRRTRNTPAVAKARENQILAGILEELEPHSAQQAQPETQSEEKGPRRAGRKQSAKGGE